VQIWSFTGSARSATPVTTVPGRSGEPDQPGGTAAPASAASSYTETGTVRSGRSEMRLNAALVAGVRPAGAPQRGFSRSLFSTR